MCGPFVLLLAPTGGAGGLAGRVGAAAVLPYQLGRVTIYATLGAAVGGLGGLVAEVTQFHWLLSAALLVAAGLFLTRGLRLLVPGLVPQLGLRWRPTWSAGFRTLAGPLQRAPQRLRRYGLGLATGFLPCGFLYAALAAAAGAGGALAGGAAMAAFALGTVPSLVAVGLLGGAAAVHWRRRAATLAAPLFLVNAATLVGLALKAAG
jgi:sulfite exporter TauE/SafE